jgi:seryl-tRNA synthetase
MHDPRALLSSPHAVQRLERRNYHLDLDVLGTLVSGRAEAIAARDAARARLNSVARDRDGRQPGGPAPDDQAQAARDLKKEIRELEEAERQCQASLAGLLLTIPNLPLDEVPDGGAEDPPVVVREWGAVPRFTFAPRDHVALGTATGVLDLVRASKLSGSRFSVTRGRGAHLERALSNFLLDLHTTEHGYTEHGLPHLVNRETMTGTGQLPKFAEDLFHTQNAGRELFLIPTAEVPLVNLYRDEILPEADLPLALTAHTACFRSEAGSYGRDTRGIIRLHQFEKVELVRICRQEKAQAQLQLLLSHAEECLRRLGLHYRVVDLRSGDLGFSARRTYDIEVWLPAQNCYREISSVSDCGDFQARRANIRTSRSGKKEFVATLNGSGLPIGRTMVALLEQYQREDGSIAIPAALVPYTGFTTIAPDGTPGNAATP